MTTALLVALFILQGIFFIYFLSSIQDVRDLLDVLVNPFIYQKDSPEFSLITEKRKRQGRMRAKEVLKRK